MKTSEYLSIVILSITAIVLIAFQIKVLGFILLVSGVLLLFFCSKKFRKEIILIYGCLALLGITPINTIINLSHGFAMGSTLFLVVAVPYLIGKYIYKNNLVRFPFQFRRTWDKKEIWYIIITAVIAYILLPVMLRSTGSYANWNMQLGFWPLTESYMGLNVVGIWDELFFVSTVLGILRRHLPFKAANAVQAIIFTSFLYTLGFQGWSFIVIYIFALIQGYIFKRTDSLYYVLVIHLTFDLILHLTLVYLHYPHFLPIFIT